MKKLGKFISDNTDKIIYLCLSILVINLIFYIFVGSKAIINSDSTFFIDYSIEQIETKSIFPDTWVHSNDFWFYSLIPIITPLIKLGVNFFLSRQIAVFVQTVLFFVLLYDFYKNVFKDKKGLIIMLLLFLSGVSGQFMSEMFGDATYGTIVFYMLLELCLFIKYLKSDFKKKKYLVFFTIILTALTACSLRFPIYIGAPLICVLLYFCYSDGIKKSYVRTFACICIAILIGFFIGKYMKSVLLYANDYESYNAITEASRLSSNLSKTFFDYLFLCGATGKSVFSLTLHLNNDFISDPSSPLIVLIFIKFIYAIITLIIPFRLFKKMKELTREEKSLLIYVSSFSFILVFFLIIGDLARWHRYMFTAVFCLNLLYPMYYNHYFKNKKNKKVVFKIGLALVVISSFIFSVNSYINIKETRLRTNGYQALAKYFEEHELYFGYSLTNIELNLFNTLTNGKVHVSRLTIDGREPADWLVSTRWYNYNYYHGKVFFYRLKSGYEVEIEKLAKEKIEFNEFLIFIYDSNDEVLNFIYSNI